MPQTRRRKTLGKLGEICKKIERHLAGQNVTLADVQLPQDAAANATPLERLQLFKEVLNETLAQLNRGEARLCEQCAAPLPGPALDELPWALRCPPSSSSCVPCAPRDEG